MDSTCPRIDETCRVVGIECEQRWPSDAGRSGGDIVCVDYGADGSALIAVVDLAVKAEKAVVQSDIVRRAFALAATRADGPRATIALLDAALRAHGETHRTWLTFGTAFVLKCLPAPNYVYAAAGIEPATVFRVNGKHEHLQVTGPMIGLDSPWFGSEAALEMAYGDALVAYTDGITETRSKSNPRDFFGTFGIAAAVNRCRRTPAALTCRAIMDTVQRWNGGCFVDDATLLIVHSTANRPSSPRERAFARSLTGP